MSKVQGKQKQRTGIVASDKMKKTRVVRVERLVRHPFLKKRIKKFTTFKVHDEKNESKVGDLVKIMETRPLSKDKRWRLIQIIPSAKKE